MGSITGQTDQMVVVHRPRLVIIEHISNKIDTSLDMTRHIKFHGMV